MNAQTRLKEDIKMKIIDQLKQEADDLRAKARKIHDKIDKIIDIKFNLSLFSKDLTI